MRRIWKLLAIASLMLVAIASCSSSDEDVTMGEDEVVQLSDRPTPIQLTEEQKMMRNNNNEFAWRLFRTTQQADDRQGSTILSPLSVAAHATKSPMCWASVTMWQPSTSTARQ